MTEEHNKSRPHKSPFVDYDYLIKVVVVGDSGVGKSQLVARFTRNQFTTNSRQTIGVEFATKTIEVDAKKICSQLWDTAGEERYRALASAYYRGAVGVLLVFDVTNSRSFRDLSHWLSEIKAYTLPSCQMILVGNKIDLKGVRKVSEEQARAYADCNGLTYMETSAMQFTNIEESFSALITDVYRKTIAKKSAKNQHATLNNNTDGKIKIEATEFAMAKEKLADKCCNALG